MNTTNATITPCSRCGNTAFLYRSGDDIQCHACDDESPAPRAEESEQSKLFPRYSFAVVTGRYKILDNRSEGATRITQIATADGEEEARTIIQALNQHSTLVEQREKLIAVLEQIQRRAGAVIMTGYKRPESFVSELMDIETMIKELLTTIEQS